MTLHEKLAILKQVAFFKHLSEETLLGVAQEADLRRFEARETLFLQKERPKGLFVVAKGVVRLFATDARGREVALSLDRPGSPVGEVANFDGGNYPASAEAVGPAMALFIHQQALQQLLAENPEMTVHVIRALSMRMRRLMRQVEQFSLQSVRERLIDYLLARANEQGPNVEITARKEMIASELGTVREVVSRTLGRLYREGLIDLAGQKITLRDVEGLRRAQKENG